MGDKLCMVCEKPVVGMKAVKIKDDAVLIFIRNLKRALRIAQENELYVCEADLKKHQQKREEFQKAAILFSILASIVLVVVLAGALISGTINFVALFASFVIALMIVLFSLIVKYVPATEGGEPVLIEPRTVAESAAAAGVVQPVPRLQMPEGERQAKEKEEEVVGQKKAGKKQIKRKTRERD